MRGAPYSVQRVSTKRLAVVLSLGILFVLGAPRLAIAESTVVIEANGATQHVIDLVYVAEGYVAADKAQFLADAEVVHQGLVTSAPFAQMRQLISARALFVTSAERGSDHPSKGIERNTAFDSTYDSNGVGRLITANNGAVQVAVNQAFPAFDIAILIVNDQRYGGSGGAVPMVSMHPSSIAVLRHEIAHNLGGLADEYTAPYPGYPPGDSEPNVASSKHLDPLPWQAWVAKTTPIPTPITAQTGPYTPIGAYEGARYQKKDIFRPAPTCIMRDLASEFCPVCAEALVLAVGAKTNMVRVHQPTQTEISCLQGACPTFSVLTSGLIHEEVVWSIDGAVVGKGTTWTPSVDLLGQHSVEASVRDTTSLVIADPTGVLREARQWQIIIEAVNNREPDAIDPTLDGIQTPDGAATLDATSPDATMSDIKTPPSHTDDGCNATPARLRRSSHDVSVFAVGLLALVVVGSARRRRELRLVGMKRRWETRRRS